MDRPSQYLAEKGRSRNNLWRPHDFEWQRGPLRFFFFFPPAATRKNAANNNKSQCDLSHTLRRPCGSKSAPHTHTQATAATEQRMCFCFSSRFGRVLKRTTIWACCLVKVVNNFWQTVIVDTFVRSRLPLFWGAGGQCRSFYSLVLVCAERHKRC